MQRSWTHGLTVLGAPTAAGAYGPGQELTPRRLRDHGLVAALESAGLRVLDLGDTPVTAFADDPDSPDAQNVPAVRHAALAIADRLSAPLASGSAAVVVGGDCTVAVGVVAAARAAGTGRVGLAYIDLDGDLNVPATADEGRLDWMGVAHLLDLPGARPELTDLGHGRPMLAPQDVVLLGTNSLTAWEQDTIDRLGITVETADRVRRDSAGVLARTARWAAGLDTLLVHLDVDVLDVDTLALAQETRRDVGGLHPDEVRSLVTGLCALPSATVVTVAEVNLDHATDAEDAKSWVVSLLVGAALAAP